MDARGVKKFMNGKLVLIHSPDCSIRWDVLTVGAGEEISANAGALLITLGNVLVCPIFLTITDKPLM